MKNKIIIIAFIALVLSGCRSSRTTGTESTANPSPPSSVVADEVSKHVWDFRDATTWLLGEINPAQFLNPPHSSWYNEGYAGYVPDENIMEELRNTDISDYTITIVMGTWCPDSRREVPRFMKIINMWGFSVEKIKFIGVDINKVAPLADFSVLGIERVPTFIFYKNNSEKGRIIEVPVTSLEQDTRNILEGE